MIANRYKYSDAHIADIGKKRVIVIGGGFGGLEVVRNLLKQDLQVVLFDKQNHHTFQPLLYQVATSGLESNSIVYPFRKCFEDEKNFYFRLGEVLKIDPENNYLETSVGGLKYDYLVIATGAITNFYGMQDIQKNAIPIKTIEDAIFLRNKILRNFEEALLSKNEEYLNSLIDYVIVGGGPTGVEIAGALSELRANVFPKDYKELDLKDMDIHLVEGSPRLLNGMDEQASAKAKEFLEGMGVHVYLQDHVKSYDGNLVTLASGKTFISKTLVWAAGVCGSPIAGIRDECIVAGRRIKVDEFNRVVGYENIFAIGDCAAMITEKTPKGHPMMAPPAMQQGELLAQNIKNLVQKKTLKPFVYKDLGSMATVGRNKAVVSMKMLNTQGMFAWFIWMFVHLMSLVGFRNKVGVFFSWLWSYISYDKSNRLIIGRSVAEPPAVGKRD